MPPPTHKNDLIGVFAQHKVAANLLMLMMMLSGVFALGQLNKQFFPTFALDFITVRVEWSGASAEDVGTSLTAPVERELRGLDGLREMTSTSAEGVSSTTLEFEEGTDMGVALDQVKERVALIRDLPEASKEPVITKIVRYEPVARLLVTGDVELRELRSLVRRMERELLDEGIAKITIAGLPEEEIAIQVPTATLRELDLTLEDVARRVAELSRDIPAGTVGRNDVSRQLRALEQQRRELGFEYLPLVSDESGQLLTLGEIAEIERRPRRRETQVFLHGRPAIELQLRRSESGDSLEAAQILSDWLEETRPKMPPGVELYLYDENWRYLRQRIELLLKNGLGGLVLVVGILFLFMNGRVAFWVAVGIPVSFMAALAVLYATGGSINMISLFALIMTLGIIVDDAIVVGEDALAHYEAGEPALQAAEGGARRMLAPVVSSSLTTIAAFLPLMLVSGIIGNILFAIPVVVICVIMASLVESFLVLPGHLRQSMGNIRRDRHSALRIRLDAGFAWFRDRVFRPLVTQAVYSPAVTLSFAVVSLMLAGGLVLYKHLPFNFFPTPEATIINANAAFVAGTPPERVAAFLKHMDDALAGTEEAFGEQLVSVAVVRRGSLVPSNAGVTPVGEHFGSMMIELVEPDARSVRNPQLIEAWRNNITPPAGLENFSIFARRAGPPGRDVEVRLYSQDPEALKAAALELTQTLRTIQGVSGIEDDLPFGPEQLIYRLTPTGEALGLTVNSIGRQLRAAYDGHIAQIFQDGDDEVEVRVVLPDTERFNLSSLETLGIMLPSGQTAPLLTVVDIEPRRGFEALRRADGQLAAQISADVDPAVAKANDIIAVLSNSTLPGLVQRYGVDFSFEGRSADQEETLADMRRGMFFALAMIYLVLAWVFASYGWPLVVMTAIPFGLVGAIAGHWVLDIDLTILSLFGMFGLAGIVVNDSIILVIFYKNLRRTVTDAKTAIIEAACKRLRAVLLTSLTTIAGLTPLLFETSLQAQFLIPMAVSISFGLAFATLLVLFFVPALLGIHEQIHERLLGTSEPSEPAAA